MLKTVGEPSFGPNLSFKGIISQTFFVGLSLKTFSYFTGICTNSFTNSFFSDCFSVLLFVSVRFGLFRFNRNTETRCFDTEPKQPKQTSCFR
jgi:hypothetical protein